MRTLIKLMTVVLLVVGTASLAEAKRRGGDFKDKIFKQLDLTEEQTKKLDELKTNQKDNMKQLRENKKSISTKFKEALASDASESELRDLHNQKMTLKKQIADARFEKMIAVRKILTPEQRTKFQDLMKEHRGKRKGKRGGRKHRKSNQ